MPLCFSARSEHFAAQTAAAAKSSLDTYPTTPAAPGGPRPARTRFFDDRSSIFEEACEETEQEKHAVSGKSCSGGSQEEEEKETSEEQSRAERSGVLAQPAVPPLTLFSLPETFSTSQELLFFSTALSFSHQRPKRITTLAPLLNAYEYLTLPDEYKLINNHLLV